MEIMMGRFWDFSSAALCFLAVLTALTNIVVEVFKGLLPRIPTALLVFLVAQGITVPAVSTIILWTGERLAWYYLAGSVVLGIVTAYCAMGNFDKLKEITEKLKQYALTEK